MNHYFVKPYKKFKLNNFDPSDTGKYEPNEKGQQKAVAHTQKTLSKLDELQELLYANASQALLIVLQAIDTGGKDGTIEHVMSGVNPQGCRVISFKAPTPLESAHDFLWRVHQAVPPKGFIGIFNRSHYEDVLVTRVHGQISKKIVEKRFREINDFEKLLVQNGTIILKFFLQISKEEQRQRLEERARNPKKRWKFNINDIHERNFWNQYQKAFQDMIEATSTPHAPWVVVPANYKWYRNLVVGQIIVDTLEDLKLKYPPGPADIDFKKIKIK